MSAGRCSTRPAGGSSGGSRPGSPGWPRCRAAPWPRSARAWPACPERGRRPRRSPGSRWTGSRSPARPAPPTCRPRPLSPGSPPTPPPATRSTWSWSWWSRAATAASRPPRWPGPSTRSCSACRRPRWPPAPTGAADAGVLLPLAAPRPDGGPRHPGPDRPWAAGHLLLDLRRAPRPGPARGVDHAPPAAQPRPRAGRDGHRHGGRLPPPPGLGRGGPRGRGGRPGAGPDPAGAGRHGAGLRRDPAPARLRHLHGVRGHPVRGPAGQRVQLRWLLVLALVGVLGTVGMFKLNVLREYQKERLTAFIDPGTDDGGRGFTYNSRQALIAIGSGGVGGKGYLRGTQTNLQYVPEQKTDFIFTVIGEELGFAGAMALLALLGLLLWRGLRIAALARTLRRPAGRRGGV